MHVCFKEEAGLTKNTPRLSELRGCCPHGQKKEETMKILKVILAIIIPPVAAFMQVGLTTHFWINIVLTILFVFPGIIHALWLVLTDKK